MVDGISYIFLKEKLQLTKSVIRNGLWCFGFIGL